MGCCSSAVKAPVAPRPAAPAPVETPQLFSQCTNTDGVKYYAHRMEEAGMVKYKFHDINGNPNAKGVNVVAAGAEMKYPVVYDVSMQKATGVGTVWEQPSGRVLYKLEEKPLSGAYGFRMLRLRDVDSDTVLYTIRFLLHAALVDYQCDIYKGDFSEKSDARYLRLYKFRADDGDSTKRALKNAKDSTLAAWSLDPDVPGRHFRVLVTPGFEANLAVALISACGLLSGE